MNQELIQKVTAEANEFCKDLTRPDLISTIGQMNIIRHEQGKAINDLSEELAATTAIMHAAIQELSKGEREKAHELAKAYLAATANAQSEIAKQSREHIQHSITVGITEQRKAQARKGADTVHNREGGSRDLKLRAQAIWAEGNYTSRNICAEQECGDFGLTYDTFRNYLTGTPAPNPWPAKERAQLAKEKKK